MRKALMRFIEKYLSRLEIIMIIAISAYMIGMGIILFMYFL